MIRLAESGSVSIILINDQEIRKEQSDHANSSPNDTTYPPFTHTAPPYGYCHKAGRYALNNDTKLMFDALGAGRRPIETKKQKKQWQAVKRGLEIARQGTIYDVLKAAYDSRLIPIQPEIERLKKLYEAEEPQEYHKTTLARFYAIQYEEVVRAINFFKVDGMYSTDHGVKGEEYDNVLLVMGRGWNLYKFEDILWKEESQLAGNDLKAYIRNRNLFYVCCSRPRKRLAILITVPISDQFRNYLNRVFGTQNVIEYTRFIKW